MICPMTFVLLRLLHVVYDIYDDNRYVTTASYTCCKGLKHSLAANEGSKNEPRLELYKPIHPIVYCSCTSTVSETYGCSFSVNADIPFRFHDNCLH